MDKVEYCKNKVLFSEGFGGCYGICIYRKSFFSCEGFFAHFEPSYINYMGTQLNEMYSKFKRKNNIKGIVLVEKEFSSSLDLIIDEVKEVFGNINIVIETYDKCINNKVIINFKKKYVQINEEKILKLS